MTSDYKYNINLLGEEEQRRRLDSVLSLMRGSGIMQALVRDNSNIYYLTGRVFRGFVYLNTALDSPRYFVRQPNHLTDADKALDKHIHKPEQIPAFLAGEGIDGLLHVSDRHRNRIFRESCAEHAR